MPRKAVTRDDISRFVVHLTKDNGSFSASDNLVSILKAKTIEARTPHCLFKADIEGRLSFDEGLRKKFRTVCFTETPLSQIRHLAADMPDRNVHLKPFGLVFKRSTVLEKGGSPAIYINGAGTKHREMLLRRFRSDFRDITTTQQVKEKHGEFSAALVSHYALCNLMSDWHDFSWEREWRFCGNFNFKYYEIVAILVDGTLKFKNRIQDEFPTEIQKHIRKIPLINPDWNYERVVDQMSQLIKSTYKAFDKKEA
jgi:hypothetical protein